jgi:hypothetical protein
MTTPYAITTNIGSASYNNYVNAPITGPLSTNRTPHSMPYHSYGELTGTRPTPPQFYPMQTPVDSQMNTNARQQYLRTSVTPSDLQQQIAIAKASPPLGYTVYSSGRCIATSSHTNYIPPIDSSLYVNIRKANSVGKTAYNVSIPSTTAVSTKNYMPSSTRSSLRRARSGGCAAPAKKGSIYNTTSTNGHSCGWGSAVRQNY